MKTIIFVFILSFLTFGCKKDEPAVPDQTPGTATIAEDTVTRTRPPEPAGDEQVPPHARAAVATADYADLRTHASAAKVYLLLADSAMPTPIPPGALRPFKNLKLKKDDGKSVFYTFETADGKPGDMFLVKHGLGRDTIWIPLHILPKI